MATKKKTVSKAKQTTVVSAKSVDMPKVDAMVQDDANYHGIAMATTVTLWVVFTYAAYILANYNIILQIKH